MVAKSVVDDASTGGGRQARHPARGSCSTRPTSAGFTRQHPGIPWGAAGHLSGHQPPADDRAPAVAGVTSVQLMPVAAFMSEPRLEQLGLPTTGATTPSAFFARTSYGAKDATEFKTMVRELHRAGLEVILDVAPTTPPESGFGRPHAVVQGGLTTRATTPSSRGPRSGLPPSRQRHRLWQQRQSGSSQHPRLVLDALRYWVTEMQVDGFRFDLAVTWRGRRGVRSHERLFKAMIPCWRGSGSSPNPGT